MTEQSELELLKINDEQRAVLEAAAATPRTPADGDGRMLAALKRRSLLDRNGLITDLGRYQVRWYSEDCGRAWGIESGTFLQYVKRGTAPQPADRGVFGSSTVRPWWNPRDVLEFERPGSARKGVHRRELSEVDMGAIVRAFRDGASIRALATQHGVAVTTLAARLEEMGEKPETTATRAVRDARMAGHHPTVFPEVAS